MELYVLRIDNYGEWSYENDACNLIGVYDNKEMVINELNKMLDIEEENGYVFDRDKNEWVYKSIEEGYYFVDIFTSPENRDNSYHCGEYVIEKKILNESGNVGC